MTTLYANKVRKNDANQGVHEASDKHNLRLDATNENRDASLSHNNVYLIYNPEIGDLELVKEPEPAHLDRIRDYQKTLLQDVGINHSNASTVNRNADIQNSKKAIQKWIDGAKTTTEEKVFFSKIQQKIEAKENITIDDLNEFQQITDGVKVSRFRDKRTRLKTLMKIDLQRGDKRSVVNATKQTEYLFKTPDKNKITWTNDQMIDMYNKFKSYFPDHNCLYVAIHHDENPENPHIHFALSNYNNRTNKFDLVQAEVAAVKKWHKEQNNGKYDPVLDTPKSKMERWQLKKYGALWQDFMFDIVNKAASPEQSIYAKRTKEQVLQDNHTYEQKKPIVEREHNRQNAVRQQLKDEWQSKKKAKKEAQKALEEKAEAKKKTEELKQKQKEIAHKTTLEVEAGKEKIKAINEQIKTFNRMATQYQTHLENAEEAHDTLLKDLTNIFGDAFPQKKWYQPEFLHKRAVSKHFDDVIQKYSSKLGAELSKSESKELKILAMDGWNENKNKGANRTNRNTDFSGYSKIKRHINNATNYEETRKENRRKLEELQRESSKLRENHKKEIRKTRKI